MATYYRWEKCTFQSKMGEALDYGVSSAVRSTGGPTVYYDTDPLTDTGTFHLRNSTTVIQSDDGETTQLGKVYAAVSPYPDTVFCTKTSVTASELGFLSAEFYKFNGADTVEWNRGGTRYRLLEYKFGGTTYTLVAYVYSQNANAYSGVSGGYYYRSRTAVESPTAPASINVPASVEGGERIALSWGASSAPAVALSGYKVERLLNGAGSWTQIYQGTLTTTTDTVPAGSTSVQYRVRAYDRQGAVSGWATSPVRTVTNNTAPGAPPSIDYPITAVQTRAYPVSWGAAADAEGNLEGYQLQRKTGGDWADAYSGPETSFSDTIDAGWASVQYRVRAKDAKGLLSGWTEGPVRQTVEPAEVLLSGEDTDLGSLRGPVNYQYAATTGDGQNANVTEALNGETLRSFSAKRGERQTLSIPPERIRIGENTITITATQRAASAVRRLTVTKGSIPAPDGPYKVEQFQDEDGKLIFPQTLAEAVHLRSGKTLEEALGVPGTLPGTVPAGCIVIWSGAANAIPDGWALCNGQNGTPDLRDRFVLGAGGKYAVKATGGEETHKLTIDEMPSHSHTLSLYSGSGGSNNAQLGGTSSVSYYATTRTEGRGQAHNNMPPYFALCYIMKL